MKKKSILFYLALAAVLLFFFFFVIKIITSDIRALENMRALENVDGGGVIITFDDNSVLDWYKADKMLGKYGWKATFFVSGFHQLDAQDRQWLKELELKGHEIGSHSKNHLSARKFLSKNSISEYTDAEIAPSVEEMKKFGFRVNSFAYPRGHRGIPTNWFISMMKKVERKLLGYRHRINALDKTLLEYFLVLRGTTYGNIEPSSQKNYANGTRVVFGLGIDDSYGNDLEYIYTVLQYARDNDKVAIFYGHRISPGENLSKYTTSYETLVGLSRYVKEKNMRFLSMRDLVEHE